MSFVFVSLITRKKTYHEKNSQLTNIMVLKLDQKLRNLLNVGIYEKLANKIINYGYSKSSFGSAPKKVLIKFFTEEEIKIVKEKIKRKPIPDETIDRLIRECDWKCCICQDFKIEQPIIIHHIEKHSKTQDDSYENLIILCLKHHGTAHTKCEIGKDPLMSTTLKIKKEEWIEAVKKYKSKIITKKTAILHYTKKISSLTNEKIQNDFYKIEFNDFIEISTNLNLLENFNNWEICRQEQEQIIKDILNNEDLVKDFMIFSIHRIPLVIHLGYLFGDGDPPKSPFQHQRLNELDTWTWIEFDVLKAEDHLKIDDSKINLSNSNQDFVILFELSGVIEDDLYLAHVPNPGGIFKITAGKPSRLWLKYKEQLEEFTNTYYNALDQIKRQNPFIKRFHIFYYGPTPPSFRIGQAINKTMFPEFILYNYNDSKYTRIMEI